LRLKPDILKPLEEIADVDYVEAKRDILLDHIPNYDAYFASLYVRADREVLEHAHRLKVIATPSTGTDHIDCEIARQKGIDILHIAQDYDLLNSFSATAEMAWCLLLACIRHLPSAFEEAKKGNWAREKFTGHQLLGKTLGILGYGRLGKMIAEFGKGFHMKVIAHDIRDFESLGIEQVDFETLLASSDIISIHIHLTEKTRGLISHEEFAKMKQGVVIINTSRGAIINEEAFLQALQSGKVSAAGLDVICGEWDENLTNHPLIRYARSHNNLIITPHIGGCTVESIVGARVFMAHKLASYIKEKMK
jgi:D-3-phosphoglycerate dehydrogenase